jgi:hypothetical protein
MASSLQSSPRLRFATYLAVFLLTICLQITCSTASPLNVERRDIEERAQPYFPDSPPSCQICEPNYGQIDSCANASIVLANFSQIIYAPLQFLSVIECACTNTFQSAYPQCVDCFEQTNQTCFLEPPSGNLSSVITGMRQICALGSSIFGHVGSVNSELPGQTPITVASAGAAFRRAGAPLLGINGDAIGALFVGMATIIIGFGMGVWTVL